MKVNDIGSQHAAYFMKILEGRNMVKKYAEYKFDMCDETVFKAWDKLMTMDADSGVVIIGIVKSGTNSIGHVELCYLETRTMDPRAADGRVLNIHDPQRETSAEGRVVDRQGFIEHVKDDGGVGVIFYVVNCVELNNIITKNAPNLHVKHPTQLLPQKRFEKALINDDQSKFKLLFFAPYSS